MKLSAILSYAGDVKATADEVGTLEKAGLDCVWVPEAYSFDAVSMMGYLAAKTDRIEIGSAILNVFGRTPATLAMTFAGLDYVSGGRIHAGIGASGPQVVEGFHGVPYDRPLVRIRETIEVMRAVWRREVVDFHGKTLDVPLAEGRGTGLGKPLKLVNHPVRDSIPVWWASQQPASVAATAEVADGWIPMFFVPQRADKVWGEALRKGKAKRSPELAPLRILAGGAVAITEDAAEIERVLDAGRAQAALYVGGMGARDKNFYNDIMRGYGWEAEAATIQDLYLSGKKKEAEAVVPREYLAAGSLVGPRGFVREKVVEYSDAGVTHLQLRLGGSLDDKVRTLEVMRTIVDEL